MLKLPDVTLVVAETRAHDLACVTLNDCVSKAEFGGVLIYSDDCQRIGVPGARYVAVKDWPNKHVSGNFYYTDAAKPITTSHALLIEWDAGIADVGAWTDDFLDYDYIGAPWPWTRNDHAMEGLNVGNGGFSLWSKRLVDFVYENRQRFPLFVDTDISRKHRRAIERETGFKWAPYDVAERFAFEGWNGRGSADNPTIRSFGYHGAFNWRHFLSREDMLARARLVQANNDLVRTGKLNLLYAHDSTLRRELPPHNSPSQPGQVRQSSPQSSQRRIQALLQQQAAAARRRALHIGLKA